jgi:hypothetical protein
MADLKLGKLPDRTPVKMTILLTPGLHRSLCEYAKAYEASYLDAQPLAELVPAMLEAFLESDRGFQRGRRGADRGPSG